MEGGSPFPPDEMSNSPEKAHKAPGLSLKSTQGISSHPTTKALGFIEEGFSQIMVIIEDLAEVTGAGGSGASYGGETARSVSLIIVDRFGAVRCGCSDTIDDRLLVEVNSMGFGGSGELTKEGSADNSQDVPHPCLSNLR